MSFLQKEMNELVRQMQADRVIVKMPINCKVTVCHSCGDVITEEDLKFSSHCDPFDTEER